MIHTALVLMILGAVADQSSAVAAPAPVAPAAVTHMANMNDFAASGTERSLIMPVRWGYYRHPGLAGNGYYPRYYGYRPYYSYPAVPRYYGYYGYGPTYPYAAYSYPYDFYYSGPRASFGFGF
jgi:hypothetical protein